jgi:hypothetical protein
MSDPERMMLVLVIIGRRFLALNCNQSPQPTPGSPSRRASAPRPAGYPRCPLGNQGSAERGFVLARRRGSVRWPNHGKITTDAPKKGCRRATERHRERGTTMGEGEWFSAFCTALTIGRTQRDSIAYRTGRLMGQLNRDFRSLDSKTSNRFEPPQFPWRPFGLSNHAAKASTAFRSR